MSNFEPIEPYNVDLTDGMVRGRLSAAASRGDKRAALTLKPFLRERAARRAEEHEANRAEQRRKGHTVAASKARAEAQRGEQERFNASYRQDNKGLHMGVWND